MTNKVSIRAAAACGLTFDTSYRATPAINGKPVDYAPKKVFESPFLNADYNSGIVTIRKGKRKKVLDFTN